MALIYISYFLAIFGYGPAFLFAPALILLTIYLKGWKKAKNFMKPLLPLLFFVPLYFLVFTFTQDSLTRFQETTNPYRADFTPLGFLKSHSIYLSTLSGGLIPQSINTVLLFWLSIVFMTLKFVPRSFYLLAAFFVSIAANSFFPQHTMFYYLYIPIIFLLAYFAFLLQTKRVWPIFFVIFLVLFNPFHNLYQVAFRLRHPATNFEEKAMDLIVNSIENKIDQGQNQVQLSNWEVTPNLQHAIDYQAMPLFMSHPSKDKFLYSYSRDTQILTFTAK